MSKKDPWMKQLMRMTQQMGRSDRSELLSESLVNLEQRIDNIKQVYHGIGKKLQLTLHASDPEKRLKKTNESSLSKSLHEAASLFNADDSLGRLLHLCGNSQEKLAKFLVDYEGDIEEKVIAPIQVIAETTIPTIAKLRKQLTKLAQTLESDRARLATAQRQTGAQTNQAALVKIKEEVEDSEHKLNMCRDQLETEMYTFIAHENELGSILLRFIESQAVYHNNSYNNLNVLIPQMRQQMEQCPRRPVFGCSLTEHLSHTKRQIATVIEGCILFLNKDSINEEGLLRMASGATKVKKLKAAFDANMVDWADYCTDPHCVAGALKQYLRELPEPLMTFQLYNDWMQAGQYPSDQRLNQIVAVLKRMPSAFYDNLQYLIKFLSMLSENSDINKMTASNIAIVIAPNLLWQQGSDGPNMMSAGAQNTLVETLITHYSKLFPGGDQSSNSEEMIYNSATQSSAITLPSSLLPISLVICDDLLSSAEYLASSRPPVSPPRSTRKPLSRSRSQIQKELWCRHVETGSLRSWPDRPRTSSASSAVHLSTSAHGSCLTVSPFNGSLSLDGQPSETVSLLSFDDAMNCDRQKQSYVENGLASTDVNTFSSTTNWNNLTMTPAHTMSERTNLNNRHHLTRGEQISDCAATRSTALSSHSSYPAENANASNSLSIVPTTVTETKTSAVIMNIPDSRDKHSPIPSKPNGMKTPADSLYHQRRHALTCAMTPPKSVHSDMYDTVFVLHTLRNNGGSAEEYRSRVRTMWDSHLDVDCKRRSYDCTKLSQQSEQNSGIYASSNEDATVLRMNEQFFNKERSSDSHGDSGSSGSLISPPSPTRVQDINIAALPRRSSSSNLLDDAGVDEGSTAHTVAPSLNGTDILSATAPEVIRESNSSAVILYEPSPAPRKAATTVTHAVAPAVTSSPNLGNKRHKRQPPPAPPSDRINDGVSGATSGAAIPGEESPTATRSVTVSSSSSNQPKPASRKPPPAPPTDASVDNSIVSDDAARSASSTPSHSRSGSADDALIAETIARGTVQKESAISRSDVSVVRDELIASSPTDEVNRASLSKTNMKDQAQFLAAQHLVSGILKRPKPAPLLTRPTTVYTDTNQSFALSPDKRPVVDDVLVSPNYTKPQESVLKSTPTDSGIARNVSSSGTAVSSEQPDTELHRGLEKKPDRPTRPARPVTELIKPAGNGSEDSIIKIVPADRHTQADGDLNVSKTKITASSNSNSAEKSLKINESGNPSVEKQAREVNISGVAPARAAPRSEPDDRKLMKPTKAPPPPPVTTVLPAASLPSVRSISVSIEPQLSTSSDTSDLLKRATSDSSQTSTTDAEPDPDYEDDEDTRF